MQTGAITEYIDVAQLVLYAFWVFFAGLIYYLHQENKREGYPLESNVPGRNAIEGFPPIPSPKTFRLADGSSVTVPRPHQAEPAPSGTLAGSFPGAPLDPHGKAMGSGVGPGAYAQRRDIPDVTIEGQARIVPLRMAGDFHVSAKDIDPRGLPVLGSDGVIGGVVRDVWVDRSEVLFRYLEVEIEAEGHASAEAGAAVISLLGTPRPVVAGNGTGAHALARRTVLLPINFSRIGSRRVLVDSVMGSDFAGVPPTRDPDTVTFLEEEKIMAYYGAGTLYASPRRAEPLL
jgi:photosynthetic reaction center H subunit